MESRPSNYYRMLLTIVGLILLALVLIMNHRHPRTQGVADITHGSIRKLVLSEGILAQSSFSADRLNSVAAVTFTASSPKEDAQITTASVVKDDTKTAASFLAKCKQSHIEISDNMAKTDQKDASLTPAHHNPSPDNC